MEVRAEIGVVPIRVTHSSKNEMKKVGCDSLVDQRPAAYPPKMYKFLSYTVVRITLACHGLIVMIVTVSSLSLAYFTGPKTQ